MTGILSPPTVMVKRRCFQPERKQPLASCVIRASRVRGTVRSFFRFVGVIREALEMNAIIYLVGLVVVIMFILSFLGLR